MQKCGIAGLSHPLRWYLLALPPAAVYGCEAAFYQEPNWHVQVFERAWQSGVQRCACLLFHTGV